VLCTRSNDNIQLIAAAFKADFGKTVEEELDNEYKVSAEYKELLGMLLSVSPLDSFYLSCAISIHLRLVSQGESHFRRPIQAIII